MNEKPKVLVAETDGRTGNEIAQALRQRGMDTLATTDAAHVLSAARSERPDAIVLNISLAGGGGLLALRRVRSNVYTAGIPVVMVAPARHHEEATRAGAQACVEPGANASALHALIQKHLRQDLDFTQVPAEVLEEPARIVALRETGLLGSSPEASFDRLTRLTQRLLGAPVALVSLVDGSGQFFKSHAGLAEPYASARRTDLTHSFCQWVVGGREPLVIEDARAHPVLRSNLAIKYMNVHSYAGVPLMTSDGHAIGSFCAIDSTARRWTEEELATLRDLTQVAEAYAQWARERHLQRRSALEVSVAVAGGAVQGVGRILRRFGGRLDAAERDELLAILEEQSGHLVESVSPP